MLSIIVLDTLQPSDRDDGLICMIRNNIWAKAINSNSQNGRGTGGKGRIGQEDEILCCGGVLQKHCVTFLTFLLLVCYM